MCLSHIGHIQEVNPGERMFASSAVMSCAFFIIAALWPSSNDQHHSLTHTHTLARTHTHTLNNNLNCVTWRKTGKQLNNKSIRKKERGQTGKRERVRGMC